MNDNKLKNTVQEALINRQELTAEELIITKPSVDLVFYTTIYNSPNSSGWRKGLINFNRISLSSERLLNVFVGGRLTRLGGGLGDKSIIPEGLRAEIKLVISMLIDQQLNDDLIINESRVSRDFSGGGISYSEAANKFSNLYDATFEAVRAEMRKSGIYEYFLALENEAGDAGVIWNQDAYLKLEDYADSKGTDYQKDNSEIPTEIKSGIYVVPDLPFAQDEKTSTSLDYLRFLIDQNRPELKVDGLVYDDGGVDKVSITFEPTLFEVNANNNISLNPNVIGDVLFGDGSAPSSQWTRAEDIISNEDIVLDGLIQLNTDDIELNADNIDDLQLFKVGALSTNENVLDENVFIGEAGEITTNASLIPLTPTPPTVATKTITATNVQEGIEELDVRVTATEESIDDIEGLLSTSHNFEMTQSFNGSQVTLSPTLHSLNLDFFNFDSNSKFERSSNNEVAQLKSGASQTVGSVLAFFGVLESFANNIPGGHDTKFILRSFTSQADAFANTNGTDYVMADLSDVYTTPGNYTTEFNSKFPGATMGDWWRVGMTSDASITWLNRQGTIVTSQYDNGLYTKDETDALLALKQDINDPALETIAKNIVPAINENHDRINQNELDILALDGRVEVVEDAIGLRLLQQEKTISNPITTLTTGYYAYGLDVWTAPAADDFFQVIGSGRLDAQGKEFFGWELKPGKVLDGQFEITSKQWVQFGTITVNDEANVIVRQYQNQADFIAGVSFTETVVANIKITTDNDGDLLDYQIVDLLDTQYGKWIEPMIEVVNGTFDAALVGRDQNRTTVWNLQGKRSEAVIGGGVFGDGTTTDTQTSAGYSKTEADDNFVESEISAPNKTLINSIAGTAGISTELRTYADGGFTFDVNDNGTYKNIITVFADDFTGLNKPWGWYNGENIDGNNFAVINDITSLLYLTLNKLGIDVSKETLIEAHKELISGNTEKILPNRIMKGENNGK